MRRRRSGDLGDEWIVVVTALSAGVALVCTLVARLRGREVETRLACPKTGARVDCTLLYDERRDACTGVVSCSAFGPGVAPSCDQSCARLLNLGLPLGTDEPPGGDPGEGDP